MGLVSIKGFWQHTVYGQIYAVESTPYGELVAAAGPLDPEHLQDLDSYEYTPQINDWIQQAIDHHELKRVDVK